MKREVTTGKRGREGGREWEDVKKRDNYYRVGCRGTLFSPSSLKHGENGEIGENQWCSNSTSNTVHYGSVSEHASLKPDGCYIHTVFPKQ